MYHQNTNNNMLDIASRGCILRKLLRKCQWFEGGIEVWFLITPECNESVDITEAEVREERTREP